MPAEPVPVRWEVADDDGIDEGARPRGTSPSPTPQLGHSVHVDAGRPRSPTGGTPTASACGDADQPRGPHPHGAHGRPCRPTSVRFRLGRRARTSAVGLLAAYGAHCRATSSTWSCTSATTSTSARATGASAVRRHRQAPRASATSAAYRHLLRPLQGEATRSCRPAHAAGAVDRHLGRPRGREQPRRPGRSPRTPPRSPTSWPGGPRTTRRGGCTCPCAPGLPPGAGLTSHRCSTGACSPASTWSTRAGTRVPRRSWQPGAHLPLPHRARPAARCSAPTRRRGSARAWRCPPTWDVLADQIVDDALDALPPGQFYNPDQWTGYAEARFLQLATDGGGLQPGGARRHPRRCTADLVGENPDHALDRGCRH